MTALNPWLIAKDVIVISLDRVTESSAGALTAAGAATSIRAYFDDISSTGTITTENISPAVSTLSNPVGLEANNQIEISEIKRRGASSSFLKNEYFNGSSTYYITWTEGITGGGTSMQQTGYYRFVACKDGTRKGKNVCIGTFEIIDIGTTNPAVAAV